MENHRCNNITISNIQHIQCDDYLLSTECSTNNLLIGKLSNLHNTKIFMDNINNRIDINGDTILNDCGIYIQGEHNQVIIKDKCKLNGTYILLIGDNNKIIIEDGTTTAGNYWGHVHFHCAEGKTIHIGKDCMFSGNIVVRNSDGHSILNKLSKERVNRSTDITIGNHVWVGMNSTLLKGASLGSGCIVGANSVVTKKFSEDTIIGGNPARELKGANYEYEWIRDLV